MNLQDKENNHNEMPHPRELSWSCQPSFKRKKDSLCYQLIKQICYFLHMFQNLLICKWWSNQLDKDQSKKFCPKSVLFETIKLVSILYLHLDKLKGWGLCTNWKGEDWVGSKSHFTTIKGEEKECGNYFRF